MFREQGENVKTHRRSSTRIRIIFISEQMLSFFHHLLNIMGICLFRHNAIISNMEKRPEGFPQAFKFLEINLRDGAYTLFPIMFMSNMLGLTVQLFTSKNN